MDQGDQKSATASYVSAISKGGPDMTTTPHFDALISKAQNKEQLNSNPEIVNEEVKERISKKER